MTKKDYQAIARALYSVAHGRTTGQMVLWHEAANAVADHFASDNPRFRRDWFLHACTTGNMGDPAKIPPPPMCAVTMGCLCAGHARNPRRKHCDTREVA